MRPCDTMRRCGVKMQGGSLDAAMRCDAMPCYEAVRKMPRGVARRGDPMRYGDAVRKILRGVALRGDAMRCDAMPCKK